ncbi:RtcB family protein [bacterium]|nr:RtcB family protein [bacterium]
MGLAASLRKLDGCRWELPLGSVAGQRVPARLFADAALLRQIEKDETLRQLANVSTLPGQGGPSLAMPDAHQGYGFPIGGVAAFDAEAGVVSPGGIGFDINCGVRLIALPISAAELRPRLRETLDALFRAVPAGLGKGSDRRLAERDLERVLTRGAAWVLDEEQGGEAADLAHCEAGGCLAGADPDQVSERARARGAEQLGSLGAGNHFLELQVVEAVFAPAAAAAFGVEAGQAVLLLHTGSRGLGHQVCGDHLRVMDRAMGRYRLQVPDRQLACVPIRSPEGRAYLGAMAAAANFAFANRQLLTQRAREVFRRDWGLASLPLVYDVAHNIAKFEEQGGRRLLVHRKGATRAFPPGHAELPPALREAGQPVLIPGSMGTASWLMAGAPGSLAESFGSCCHGAGRRLSRGQAERESRAESVIEALAARGILIAAASRRGITEEKPEAYKDVDAVVEVVAHAGLATKVARLRPLGVVKG